MAGSTTTTGRSTLVGMTMRERWSVKVGRGSGSAGTFHIIRAFRNLCQVFITSRRGRLIRTIVFKTLFHVQNTIRRPLTSTVILLKNPKNTVRAILEVLSMIIHTRSHSTKVESTTPRKIGSLTNTTQSRITLDSGKGPRGIIRAATDKEKAQILIETTTSIMDIESQDLIDILIKK